MVLYTILDTHSTVLYYAMLDMHSTVLYYTTGKPNPPTHI